MYTGMWVGVCACVHVGLGAGGCCRSAASDALTSGRAWAFQQKCGEGVGRLIGKGWDTRGQVDLHGVVAAGHDGLELVGDPTDVGGDQALQLQVAELRVGKASSTRRSTKTNVHTWRFCCG